MSDSMQFLRMSILGVLTESPDILYTRIGVKVLSEQKAKSAEAGLIRTAMQKPGRKIFSRVWIRVYRRSGKTA